MKHACEDILPANARGCVSKMSADVIHLNVGGISSVRLLLAIADARIRNN